MRSNDNQMWGPEGRGQFENVRRQRGEDRRGGRGEGRRGHGRPGFGGPFVGPGWGPDFGGEMRRGGRGGGRARRGDVRSAILDVLRSADDELNGYQIGQQIAERTDDAWRPSPGSIYPTIAQLEDEGLVTIAQAGGRKIVGLTQAGRRYVEENAETLAAVWSIFSAEGTEGPDSFKQALNQTFSAIWQVSKTGTPEQRERAREILDDTRRKLYGILAE